MASNQRESLFFRMVKEPKKRFKTTSPISKNPKCRKEALEIVNIPIPAQWTRQAKLRKFIIFFVIIHFKIETLKTQAFLTCLPFYIIINL